MYFDVSLSPDLRNMLSVKKKPVITALCLLLVVIFEQTFLLQTMFKKIGHTPKEDHGPKHVQ